jgi:hypothetical protein
MAEKQYFRMCRVPPRRRKIALDYEKLTRALSGGTIITWGMVPGKVPKYKKQNAEFAEFFNLSKCFQKKVRCDLTYSWGKVIQRYGYNEP